MNGKLLELSAKYLCPLLFIFSLILLLRGHNLPGGGFIAGLTASVAFALLLMSVGSERAKRLLHFDPRSLVGIGLITSVAAALFPSWLGQEFFKGLWAEAELPFGVSVSIGTPLLFDLGVYLVVMGVLMIILISLLEE